jgi:hypothetical protein
MGWIGWCVGYRRKEIPVEGLKVYVILAFS